jgi:precorrin-3B C17-methyltransferase
MNLEAHGSAGILYIVGLGPGSPGLLTPEAAAALEAADTVVGYRGYLDLIDARLAGKTVVGRELGEEVARARAALELAEAGRTVALVSSGDAGIYGMGGVAWELAAQAGTDVEIVVVPGVTAACSAAARLGAPLAHDWASVSLSDLLTPWDVIVRRVDAAARADFVLVLYNPASRSRTTQLAAVAGRILAQRSAETPVGLVENAYRPGERVEIVTLGALAAGGARVGMFTTVVVGSSRTFVARAKMITPRIYAAKSAQDGGDDSPRAAHGGGTTPHPNPPPQAGRSPIILPPPLRGRAGVGGKPDASATVEMLGDRNETPATQRVPDPASANAPGDRIMAESLAIIERELGSEPADPAERAVLRRVIHASADFDYVASFRFHHDAIAAAISALAKGAKIAVDVEMLRAGIRRDLAGPLGVAAVCGLNDGETADRARALGLTRSAAGMRVAAEQAGEGAIVAIGNAPTALDETLRLIAEEGWRPACVIGIPVGFVGVDEAKRRLMEQHHVPFITSLGRKGGTAVTTAVVNALLELANARPGGAG